MKVVKKQKSNEFPYSRLWESCCVVSRKLERQINKDGFGSLSKDQVNIHQKLIILMDELKHQIISNHMFGKPEVDDVSWREGKSVEKTYMEVR